jgi:hypothetical protein
MRDHRLISKLKEVTVARGATPAEAAVAAKKVRELTRRDHALPSSDFFTAYGEEATPKKGRPRDAGNRSWVDRVASYRTNRRQ